MAETSFVIGPLEDERGNPLKYTVSDLNCRFTASDFTGHLPSRIVKQNDGSLSISFVPPRTGKWTADIMLNGVSIIPNGVEVIVDPQDLIQQEVPTENLLADADGSIHLSLAPLTDASGVRISYDRHDVKCDISGGPNVASAVTWAMVHKNSNGEIDLHLKCRLPGQYQAQVYLFGRPILANLLNFTVPRTENSPKWEDEENEICSNPIAGRTSIFSIQGNKDYKGRPIETSYPQQNLIMKFKGPSECVGTVITMRLGGWGIEFTPATDGYYEGQLYYKTNKGEEALFANPLNLYIGTLSLHQQIAAGGKPLDISVDGVSLTLRALSDHEGNYLEYDVADITFEYTGPETGSGTAEKLEDGRIRLFMNPLTPGTYTAQVFLKGKPILARDIQLRL